MKTTEKPEDFNAENWTYVAQFQAERSHFDSPDWFFKLLETKQGFAGLSPDTLKQVLPLGEFVSGSGYLIRQVSKSGLQKNIMIFEKGE